MIAPAAKRRAVAKLQATLGLSERRAQLSAPVLPLPNQSWSLDRVCDQFVTGRSLRVLNIVDDVTRECLREMVDTSILGRWGVRDIVDRSLVAAIHDRYVEVEQHFTPKRHCYTGFRRYGRHACVQPLIMVRALNFLVRRVHRQ